MPALLIALAALACAGSIGGPGHDIQADRGASGADATPWSGLRARGGPEDFRFLVVTDRTGDHRDGVFEAAIDKINLLRPSFVVSVGDLIEGYTESREQLDAEWAEFDGFVDRLEMPFFYAPGNHDFSNEAMSRDWRDRFGPSFYHFRYRGVLFLVLNSELFSSVMDRGQAVPGPDTQAAQMAYAQEVLAAHGDARWTFVIVHQPFWERRDVPADWQRIEEWLGSRPYTVFAGHVHRYTSHRRHDRRFITLATTGGGSRLRGIDHGEFDHVALVSMEADGPVIANLLLDGIHGPDMRSADTRNRMSRLEAALQGERFDSEGVRFRRGVARFSVENKGDDPIEVEARPQPGRDLVPESAGEARSVAPGKTARFEIPVAARSPTRFGELAPATVEWTLRGQKADGSPLELDQTSWLLPEQVFDCAPAASEVRVDGVLDEWAQLPFTLEARPAKADAPKGASLRFGAVHDADFLYLGVRVTDPSPFFSRERVARDQDAVQIVLDARPALERDLNEGFFRAQRRGTVAKLLVTTLVPDVTHEDPIFARLLPPLPDGSRRAARTVPGGYEAELAIPRAFLDERAGGPWQSFRLNVSLQDFARDGDAHVTHWWRPSRFGVSGVTPVPGSGTFTRRAAR